MPRHEIDVEVSGPWSLETSKSFWEGFTPAALAPQDEPHTLHTVFRVDGDWSRAEVSVSQRDTCAHLVLDGDGDLGAAASQVSRFLALDVDAHMWPGVGDRDPIIADAQRRLPGLRPCGFHSPYEAAVWCVLSQRTRIVQAAGLRDELISRHGQDGALPAPAALARLDLDLPGRKTEYLHAVGEAALEGRLDGASLRDVSPDQAVAQVQEVKGLGPFAAELVVVRGANAPDALPHHEKRLDAEIAERYGADQDLQALGEVWRPFRTWAVVHLRALREARTHEIAGH